jgi:hypothetical protein
MKFEKNEWNYWLVRYRGGYDWTKPGHVDICKSRKNVTSVCPAGFSGGLHRVLLKTGKTELSLCTYVRFRSPSLFEFQAIDGRRRDFRWTKAKAKIYGCTFVCNALGYRLMQLAAKRMGNEGLHLAQRPFLYFGDWLHIGVRKGWGQDTVRRDEKTKSVVKVSSQRDQPTTIQPTKPTSQKTKTSQARGGSKESTKAQAS